MYYLLVCRPKYLFPNLCNCKSKFSDAPKEASLLLILKWGGELTPSGRIQAEELGRVFRCMYPGGQGNYS